MKWLGKTALAFSRWKIGQLPPNLPKYVLIAAPHTSNWDLVHMQSIGYALGMQVSWMGKHTLFKPPFGPLMRAMGGVPVYRQERRNMVDQMAQQFADHDRFILAVPPEGTRGKAEHWRSGFYHIARAANVPIVPGYLDYSCKTGGFGPPLLPTGDMKADMDVLRAFYATFKGKFHDQFSPVRLKEEVDLNTEST